MFKARQLRELIIKPALHDLVLYSEDAVELLVFTCATESLGGTYLKQINGPALGIYQMEPDTYNDLWVNYIQHHRPIFDMLLHNFGCVRMPDEDRMIYDLRYASAMTRIFYERLPHPLPPANDLNEIWDFYKCYYNSSLGAANKQDAIKHYHNFTSP